MTWWQLCNLINAPHRFFPSPVSSHRHLFTFPNNQSICASGQCEQCGQCDARVSCPRICDGLYREIGQDANPAKTSKRGEAGVQERSRFHFQSFQYFAKQEKEEETSWNKGGSRLLVEQIRVHGIRKAIPCPASSSKSSVPNSPTQTCACRGSSLHRPCLPWWSALFCSSYLHNRSLCNSFGCFVCRSERLSRSWRWSRLSYRKLGVDRKLFPTGRWDSSIGININFQMSFRMYKEIKEYHLRWDR